MWEYKKGDAVAFIVIVFVVIAAFIGGRATGDEFPCGKEQVLLSTGECVSQYDHNAHVGGE